MIVQEENHTTDNNIVIFAGYPHSIMGMNASCIIDH